MQALASVLKARGTSLTNMFAAFADGNLRPETTYLEGALNGYEAAPDGRFAKQSGWWVTKLDHMTSTSATVLPQAGTKTLKIIVDMPAKATGSAAVVTVSNLDGTVQTSRMTLSKEGNASATYPFDAATVKSVALTMVNASTKFGCWQRGAFSCQGVPKQDDLTSRMKLLAYS
jgi:hypothetical protein